jgi:hypothetical protein
MGTIFFTMTNVGNAVQSGPFYSLPNNAVSAPVGSGYWFTSWVFNSERVVPTANKNQTRAWGALACAYLGQPAS